MASCARHPLRWIRENGVTRSRSAIATNRRRSTRNGWLVGGQMTSQSEPHRPRTAAHARTGRIVSAPPAERELPHGTPPLARNPGQGLRILAPPVQRFLARLRREEPSPAEQPRTARTKGPTPPHVVALILQRHARRTNVQRAYRDHLSRQDPTSATAATLADDFLLMLRRHEGEETATWSCPRPGIPAAQASPCPYIADAARRFVATATG